MIDVGLSYTHILFSYLWAKSLKCSFWKHNDNLRCAITSTFCNITRITTFIKKKFKKSDDQTNIEKYRVVANITEYHMMIISKLIFLRITIPKLVKIRQSFHVKDVWSNVKNQHVFKWTLGLFCHNYQVAALSTLYQTVIGISIPSLKSKGKFWHT